MGGWAPLVYASVSHGKVREPTQTLRPPLEEDSVDFNRLYETV